MAEGIRQEFPDFQENIYYQKEFDEEAQYHINTSQSWTQISAEHILRSSPYKNTFFAAEHLYGVKLTSYFLTIPKEWLKN